MRSTLLWWWAAWAAVVLVGASRVAALDQTQTLPLSYGWNAVWLEVAPRNPDGTTPTADQVFVSNSEDAFVIDQIAAPTETEQPTRYVTGPEVDQPQTGWRVWKRNPGSGERDTILVQGHSAFLVRVVHRTGTTTTGSPAGVLRITGKASFHRPSWNRDRFQLAGFGIEGRVSFSELFGASGWSAAEPTAFRMNSATGSWEAVGATDPVESGRSYWISLPFQLPDTRYAGPLAVDFDGAVTGKLDFGRGPGLAEIVDPLGGANPLRVSQVELTLTQRSSPTPSPVRGATLTRILPEPNRPEASEMLLFRLERIPGQLQWRSTTTGPGQSWDLGTVAPGTSRSIPFGLTRNWVDAGPREHLYRLRVLLGAGAVLFDLPVAASGNGPVQLGSGPSARTFLPGLWSGIVTIDQVTSLTSTNDRPVVPTASKTSIRMLIHVGTNGIPVLLSRAMLMQTRTADASVTPTPVLVLSESQIPFFEGIEERDGKKVGMRYETAFFDMPRDWRPGAQGAPLTAEVQAFRSLGQNAIAARDLFDYLATRPSRPPSLAEVYWDRWPLEGTWAPGGGARTPPNNPLLLDPFHRSNPFRHAFHPQHGAGYAVRRAFLLSLDDLPFQGELTGTYEETLSGLATADLVYRGRVILRQVSDVTELR